MRSIYPMCRSLILLFCLTVAFVEMATAQCEKPTGLSVTGITDSSAILQWLGNDGEEAFSVDLRSKGRTPNLRTTFETDTNSLEVDQLLPGSEYRFRVKSTCASGGSSGSTRWFVFQTPGMSPEEPCSKATNLQVVSATMTTATLAWSGSPFSTHYEVEVRSKGNTPVYFFEKSLLDTSITIFGLDPSGKYQFRVRTTCVNSAVSGSTAWMMFTPGDVDEAETCPFVEDLMVDSITAHSAIFSWSAADQTTVYSLTIIDENNQDTLIIAPASSPVSIDSLQSSTGYSVHLVANCVDALPSQVSSSFTTLDELPGDTCLVPQDLSAAPIDSGNFLLSWSTVENAGSYQLQIAARDTVLQTLLDTTLNEALYQFAILDSIEEYSFRVRALCSAESFSDYSEWLNFPVVADSLVVLVCDMPQQLMVDTVIGNNAFIRWLSGGTTDYQLEIQDPDTSMKLLFSNGSAEPLLVLPDLRPHTDYQIRLSALCGEDTSEYSPPVAFSTLDSLTICLPPGGLTALQVDENTAMLNWGGEANSTYEVEVKPVDTASTIILRIPAFESSLQVGGLDAGPEYEFRVRKVCGEEDTSFYSNWITFTIEDTVVAECEEPSDIQLDSVSATAAWLSWSGPEGAEYQLYFREKDTIGPPLQYYTQDHFIYFDSLMPQIEYQVQIQTVCGDEQSGFAEIFYFTTLDENVATPDSCPAPTGFELDSVDATMAWISWEGADSLLYLVEVSGGSYEWQDLVANPSVALTDLPADGDFILNVRVICSESDTSDRSDDFVFQTLELPVEPDDTCSVPIAEILEMDSVSALFSWTSSSSGALYLLEVEHMGYTPAFNLITTTRDTHYLVEDLLPGGVYQWKVAAFCDDGTYSDCTPWMVFSTDGEETVVCPAPTGLIAEITGESSAMLQWDTTSGAIDYEVEIENLDTTPDYAKSILVTGNFLAIDSLAPGGTYQFKVNVQCSDASISDDSDWFMFTTLTMPDTGRIQAGSPQKVQLAFPNPVRNTMTVQIPKVLVGADATVELNDMMGRVVLTNKAPRVKDGDKLQFEVGNLREGIYQLSVKSAENHFHELIFISR